MRIAVDLQPLQSRDSRGRGIGRYARSLTEALLADPGPCEFVLYGSGALPAPELTPPYGDAVHLLPLTDDGLDPVNEALVKTFLLGERVDAVFLPSPVEMRECAVPFFGDFPASLFVVSHDVIPLLFPEKYIGDEHSRAFYLRRLRNIAAADRVLCNSDCTRRDTVAELRIPEGRALTIGAGTAAHFRPLQGDERGPWRERLRARFGIDRPYLLCTGGGDSRKNLTGLIEAFGLLPPALRDARRLVIVCRLMEHEQRALRDCAAAAGLDPRAVILTDFISDDELNALYALCELFVFPSLYEGFGLPLVEAMTCGAPVAAADNSSLVEIVPDPAQQFDGASPAAIAERLAGLLSDPDLLRRLRERAPTEARRFTWEIAAERAREAFLAAGPRRAETFEFARPAEPPAAAPSPSPRPRIAYFSPFRPLNSGISDYSAEILPALSDHYDCDLYVDGGYTPAVRTGRVHRVYNHASWDANTRRRGIDYRALVYQMGNSSFHVYMYSQLLRYAGVSVLHDFNMSGMLHWADTQMPEWGITLEGELVHAYGPEEGRQIAADLRANRYGVGDLPARGVYTNRRIFTRSLGVIVHNGWAYRQALKERGADNDHIALIPHQMRTPEVSAAAVSGEAVREMRRRRGVPEDALVVATFGAVAETKRPYALLDAFRGLLAERPDAFLVFVGAVEMPTDFDAEVSRRGLSGRTLITGFVPEIEVFNEYLRLADICVTLRYPSNGETSGALMRMLAHGKASLVSDIGSFADFPDSVVHKVPTPDRAPDEAGEVLRALRVLASDADYRTRLGAEGEAYMRREHAPERCARLYRDFIEGVLADPRTRLRLLADHAGREAARAAGARELTDAEIERLLARFTSALTAGADAPAVTAASGVGR